MVVQSVGVQRCFYSLFALTAKYRMIIEQRSLTASVLLCSVLVVPTFRLKRIRYREML